MRHACGIYIYLYQSLHLHKRYSSHRVYYILPVYTHCAWVTGSRLHITVHNNIYSGLDQKSLHRGHVHLLQHINKITTVEVYCCQSESKLSYSSCCHVDGAVYSCCHDDREDCSCCHVDWGASSCCHAD